MTHQSEALLLLVLLVWLLFDKAQLTRRQGLYPEAASLTMRPFFGFSNPRGIPFAHRAVPRSKLDPRSRLNHRRKALFLLLTPYEPALGGGECKAFDIVVFDGSSISPSKTTPLEAEPKKHS